MKKRIYTKEKITLQVVRQIKATFLIIASSNIVFLKKFLKKKKLNLNQKKLN